MEENNKAKEEIVNKYLNFIKKNNRIPTISDMLKESISRDKIRHHFGNITNLHNHVYQNHKNIVDNNVLTEDNVFTSKKLKELKENLKDKKRFFITSIVSGKRIHKDFLDNIKHYCDINDAVLLLLPCMDKANRSSKTQWNFDPILKNENIVFDDVKLNDKFFVSSIKLSAKHINPLTGLQRIGQRNNTFVYASPKQALDYVATTNGKYNSPHAIMTPGALTLDDYSTDKYMSERTSYIASNDHVYGGIIVEIYNKNEFYFRQVQANSRGEFTDLGKTYYNNSGNPSVKNITSNFILGDLHAGSHNQIAWKTTLKMLEDSDVNDVFLHDFFDGYSISHHHSGKPLKIAEKYQENKQSLIQELKICGSLISEILKRINGNIIIVKSNHDEFLDKYLELGLYVQDAHNHRMALELAMAKLDGKDPLKYAIKEWCNDILSEKDYDRLIFLSRKEDYKLAGVELGAHGDLGSNGTRGSRNTLEKAYGQCVVGHTHSAGILRGVWHVGTLSNLDLDYNRGPSSWTHTNCIFYMNGSRQLLNIINGRYKLND